MAVSSSRAQALASFCYQTHQTLFSPTSTSSMRTSFSSSFKLFRSLTHQVTSKPTLPTPRLLPFSFSSTANSTHQPHLGVEQSFDFDDGSESESFEFDVGEAKHDLKHLATSSVDVKGLEDLPEQWRRAKIAWLCKELPSHKSGTLVRILNAQKKWLHQENAMYIAVHFMRIRENESAFRVKWIRVVCEFFFEFTKDQ